MAGPSDFETALHCAINGLGQCNRLDDLGRTSCLGLNGLFFLKLNGLNGLFITIVDWV